MSRIYEDMFLADQWLRDTPAARPVADTTLFFDPIFKRYGYTFADFDRSVGYYLDRPEKYAKILSRASERLRHEKERMDKELTVLRDLQDERERLHELYGSERDFRVDSVCWGGSHSLWPVLSDADTMAVRDTIPERDPVEQVQPEKKELEQPGMRPDKLIELLDESRPRQLQDAERKRKD